MSAVFVAVPGRQAEVGLAKGPSELSPLKQY